VNFEVFVEGVLASPVFKIGVILTISLVAIALTVLFILLVGKLGKSKK